MICPDDGTILTEVKARSFYGWDVTVDQCPDCKGLWFDSLELFPIDTREALRLDAGKVPASVVDSTGKLCPRCSNLLSDIKDPNFAENYRVHVCRSCQGMWLYSGIFTEYKQYQLQKRNELSAKLTADENRRQKEIADMTPLENFSKFLMTPYYGSTRSVDVQQAGQVAATVLGLLLRFLLRI